MVTSKIEIILSLKYSFLPMSLIHSVELYRENGIKAHCILSLCNKCIGLLTTYTCLFPHQNCPLVQGW